MDKNVLKAVADAAASEVTVYLTQGEAVPLLKEGFITVDSNQADPNDASKRAVTITEAGIKFLASGSVSADKPSGAAFQVQSGIDLPKVKRRGGGGGREAKYPFDTMGVGDFFFVSNDEASKGDAVKTLNSAAGSANQRYAEDVIENGQVKTKVVTRAKRDKDRKVIKDTEGNNVMETVTLPVKNFTRKYVVRAVEGGKVYGSFTAPSNGAVVFREK